uniref:protein cramped-like n=1 Tax=Styela clava TaxID=7725 RepID=UPI00193AD943|nr:protein cramped-like [Styela clava]XP_039264954.1 protein cramped-like [Styela clava]
MASAIESSYDEHDRGDLETSNKSETLEQQAELEQGRVWRRGGTGVQSDKKNSGPVLRTTVKPVKRFRPESNTDRSNPSPSRKKRIKTSAQTAVARLNECTALITEGTSKEKLNNANFSPDSKGGCEKASTPDKLASDETVIPVKKKRVWEQWTVDDKNYFFEAVAVYGKDFEAIRTAIAQKHRKKGEECVAKTKDQVRHLYYRTWTMISKIIDVDAYPLTINKAFQELYAVINYGEIRKKLGGNLKKKGIEKLNELIRDGTTSVKIKGKNFRIKTPSCKALKKMNPEYQGKEGVHDLPLVSDTRRMKIPLCVTLELCPATMSSWNQVHSIAHNPRLRIKLSMECQLSTVFTYLEKKWKPLSGRLLKVADQCQSKNNNVIDKLPKIHSNVPSTWDKTLVIQTPPDASVNTRIMVFQISNNKTHCVVSYALRKLLQSSEKTPDKMKNHDKVNDRKEDLENEDDSLTALNSEVTSGVNSESEVIDSCLSSEEDCDYDSANEILKDTNIQKTGNNCLSPSNNLSNSPNRDDDTGVQSLDIVFAMKEGGVVSPIDSTQTRDVLPEEVVKSSLQPVSDNSVPEIQSIETESSNIVSEASVCNQPASLSDTISQTLEMETNHSSNEETVTETNTELCNAPKQPPDMIDNSISNPSNSVDASENSNLIDQEDITVEPVSNKMTDCTSEDTFNGLIKENKSCSKARKDKRLVLSIKLFGKSGEVKKRKPTKKSKTGKKNVQTWTAKDCRKTTIAEIYMMLGKPSVFKLCYDWIQMSTVHTVENEEPTSDSRDNMSKDSNKVSFSTGLMALIQAAKLTQLVSANAAEKKSNAESCNQNVRPKSPKIKTKHMASQCAIIKPNQKSDDKSSHQSSSTNSTSSNTHSRRVGKIIPVETLIVDKFPGSGFAVPAAPITRQPRKIAANPNQPMQGTRVSQETLNWLYRDRRANRQVRKPIVLDRNLQNKKNSFKQMKTFSFVQRGSNKIGFLPSKPVLASVPTMPVSQDPQRFLPSSSLQADTSSALNIDKFLGLDIDTNVTQPNVISSSNLLIQAAKEAGVAPPTPIKNCDAPISSSVDISTIISNSSQTPITQNVVTTTDCAVDVNEPVTAVNEFMLITTPIVANTNTTLTVTQLQDLPGLDTASVTTLATPSLPSDVVTTGTANLANTLSSSLTPVSSSTAIDSLLDISWTGHEMESNSFAIESMMDKLVGGEKDIVLTSLNNKSKKSDTFAARNLESPSPLRVLDENSNGPSLSRDNFDLHMTPMKSSDIPVHPWTINTNSRDSLGLSGVLNTPQKILPSDTEDSLDGLMTKSNLDNRKDRLSIASREISFSPTEEIKKSSPTKLKQRLSSQDQSSSSNFLSGTDPELDIQLQCMLNENSVDYISKFQDLVRQTTEYEEMSVIASDENARDGHISTSPMLGNIDKLNMKETKDDS